MKLTEAQISTIWSFVYKTAVIHEIDKEGFFIALEGILSELHEDGRHRASTALAAISGKEGES
jgi:hypothetical protein